MRSHSVSALALLIGISFPAFGADELDAIDNLIQAEFRNLSQDLGAALSYKAVAPVEPLGITGFDIGLEATATDIEHPGAWDTATSGSAPRTLYFPKVHLHKGLPAGIDVGVFWATALDTNIDLWGAELRYTLLEGGVAAPAVGLRVAYSELSGVEQLDLNTKSVELGVSKGFALLTPYAGVGRVWVESTPDPATTLQTEDFSEAKYFIGANLNLVAANLALEWDRVGETSSTSLKLGFRF